MDRAAFGGQPDQQGRLQDQAAALDQSTLEEFDSVLDEAALASPNSPAGDSAERSADQEPSSDEYSELTEDSALQLGALGAAPDADAGAPAGGVRGILGQADSELAKQLKAQCSRTQLGFSVSAPRSKAPSEVKYVELEQGFLACGVNFLPLANVMARVRRKWRRLAYKLWLMKAVGLGLALQTTIG